MKKAAFFLCFIVISIGTIAGVCKLREQKAISLAQKYLVQKYDDIEFVYVDSEYRRTDPSQFYVYFSSMNPYVSFCVRVQSDLKIKEDESFGEVITVADNYFQQWFRMKANTYYQSLFIPLPNIRTTNLYVINNALYGYEYAADISLNDDIITLLNKMNYTLVIYLTDSSEDAIESSLKDIMDILDGKGVRPSRIELRDDSHVVFYQDNLRG